MNFNKNTENVFDYYKHYKGKFDQSTPYKEIWRMLNKMLNTQDKHRTIAQQKNNESLVEAINKEIEILYEAINIFKKEDEKKEYDKKLEKAYKDGLINEEKQEKAKELLDEINHYFAKQLYSMVINTCTEAINEGNHISEIYDKLALSYYEIGEDKKSIKVLNEGLKNNPNDYNLLSTGVDLAYYVTKDVSESQKYLNRLFEINPNDAKCIATQYLLYLYAGKQDLAYKKIDEYIAKKPDDQIFKRECAYNLCKYKNEIMYIELDETRNKYIASQEAYKKGLYACSKALELYRDRNLKKIVEEFEKLSITTYNTDNTEYIKYQLIGGTLILLQGILMFSIGLKSFSYDHELAISNLLLSAPVELLGLGIIYSGHMLRRLSYRPAWQVKKIWITNQPEPEEKKYIRIGKINTKMLKWTAKIQWGITKLIFKILEWGFRLSR